MAKKNELQVNNVTIEIEQGTIIVIGDVQYSGTVTVDTVTAETLKSTGKVNENGNPANS